MIKSLKGKMIVKNVPDNFTTPSGIIQSTNADKNMMGEVLHSSYKDVKVGDIVLFGRYSGKDLEFEGNKCRRIEGDDVMAITNGTWDSISPVSDWILAEPVELDTKTASGIILPATEEEKKSDFTWAKVLKVGPGKVLKSGANVEMTVSPGDEVLFGPYCSYLLKIWGSEATMFRVTEVEMVRREG